MKCDYFKISKNISGQKEYSLLVLQVDGFYSARITATKGNGMEPFLCCQ